MTDYEELDRKTLCDGFLRVDAVTFRHRRHDGRMSAPQTREIAFRRDGVGGLIHDVAADTLIFVEQFRAPARAVAGGVLTEVAAGLIDEGETAEAAFRREAREETGCILGEVTAIGECFTTPGAFTERLHLFHGVAAQGPRGLGGGNAREGEDIRVIEIRVAAARAALEAGAFIDAKTIICLQWFYLRGPGA